jgi:hypothetical protein
VAKAARAPKSNEGNAGSGRPIDSWVAPGVGLVKSTVTDEDGRVLYRLELTDHKP